ncbi:MAG: ThiF family adenylyltransferase [Micrococcaceae bacterium]
MRINPGLSFIITESDARLGRPLCLRIGTGGRHARILDPGPEVLRFLRMLREGVVDGSEVRAGQRCGLSPTLTHQLLADLVEVLVSTPPSAPRIQEAPLPPMYDAEFQVGYASLQATEHLADAGTDVTLVAPRSPSAVMEQRRTASIQVVGLGRTGAALAQTLAYAGVGQLLLWDSRQVGFGDTGPTHQPADVGRLRSVAVARRLQPEFPHQTIFPSAHPIRPALAGTLTVVTAHGGIDPTILAEARAAEHPLLPVVVRDDDVLIGPWSLPGASPCPLCFEPLRDAQTTAPAGESFAVSTAAAGLGAQAVLNRIDGAGVGAPGVAPGVVVRVDAATAAVQTVELSPAAQCVCAQVISASTSSP